MSRFLSWIGLLLLLSAFSASLWRVAFRARAESDPSVVHLRIAHWHMHDELRAAYQEVITRYERLHPGVRIEQVVVPSRLWPAWQRTQLVGGTAPDIIQVGRGSTDEVLAGFFQPLTAEVAAPNPYNAGTPLAGIPWRDTFFGGLDQPPCYSPALLEVFGVPSLLNTYRVFCNRPLWRRIFGDDHTPETYEAFLEDCRRIEAWAREQDRTLVPLAASLDTAPYFLDRLAGCVTQRLAGSLDPRLSWRIAPSELALARLQGRWDFETPAVRASLDVMRDVSRHMLPGFLQLRRDDAVFYFAQQNALMMVSGTFEAVSILSSCSFEVGVFDLPLPATTHPRLGEFVLGPPAEATAGADGAFGLYAGGKHPGVALDFLRYLTSQGSVEIMARRGNRLPAVLGVEPNDNLRIFKPRADGYPSGFSYGMRGLGGSQTAQVWNQDGYRLLGPRGDVGAFIASSSAGYDLALRADLVRFVADQRRAAQRADLLLIARLRLGDHGAADRLFEAQTLRDLDISHIETVLGTAAPGTPASPPLSLAKPLLAEPSRPSARLADAWRQVARLRFDDAFRLFQAVPDDQPESDEARLGLAVALLGRQPGTRANVSAAAGRLETLAAPVLSPAPASDHADDVAFTAAWLLARIRELHDFEPDPREAARLYAALAATRSTHAFAQRARIALLLPGAMAGALNAAAPTGDAAPADPSARRDYHLTLGYALLMSTAPGEQAPRERALRHLLAAENTRRVSPLARADLLVGTMELARELGRPDIAREAGAAFLQMGTQDNRTRLVTERLAALPSPAR